MFVSRVHTKSSPVLARPPAFGQLQISQEVQEMLDADSLDIKPNPQNVKRKLYRVMEDQAERAWTRSHAAETGGSF
jgi:hypothetical protein